MVPMVYWATDEPIVLLHFCADRVLCPRTITQRSFGGLRVGVGGGGLSGFPRFREKSRPPPPPCQLFWVGGRVAELGRRCPWAKAHCATWGVLPLYVYGQRRR